MTHSKPMQQRGLSLIELMIAITISITLLAGVVQIFSNSKSTYRTQEALSRVSENVRFALEIVTQDISIANFWGCNTGADKDGRGTITNILDPNAGANSIDFVLNPDADGRGLGNGLFGVDGGVGGTDTIQVRGLVGFPIVIKAVNIESSPVELQAANATLAADSIVALTDCDSTDIFKLTSIDADNLTLRHAAATGAAPQNVSANFSKATYGQNSALYRADSITYSLQNGANNRLALFRNRNNNSVELISDVDDFQVQYGLDTDGDLDADSWTDATAALNYNSVVAVRLTIVFSSANDFVSPVQRNPSNDRRLGKTVVTTIALRNHLN